jgi:hypothetical protein
MSMTRLLVVASILAGIATAACGDDDDDKTCNVKGCTDCITALGEDDELSKCDKACDKCQGD